MKKKTKKNSAFDKRGVIPSQYAKDIGKIPLLSRSEEEKTIRLAQAGDTRARDKLIKANLRFVVRVALQHQSSHVLLDDLISEGNLGLIEAIQRFDQTRGYKFISYAVWWIRQYILLLLKRKHIVLLPVNHQEDQSRLLSIAHVLDQKLGRYATTDELANEAGMSRARTQRAIASTFLWQSLDVSNDTEKGVTMLDTLPDTSAPTPEDCYSDKEISAIFEEMFRDLSPREYAVIDKYYGLSNQEQETFEAIGKELGVTRERVRQIRNKTLDKLRKFAHKRELSL